MDPKASVLRASVLRVSGLAAQVSSGRKEEAATCIPAS